MLPPPTADHDVKGSLMAHSRSGAALIMAIVILAALLMLGLPFLFSQSASLSGTRSFAHSQQAQTGRSTAEDLGVGAATYLTDRLYAQGSTTESTDLNRVGKGLTPATEPRRRTLDLSPSGHGYNPSEPRNTALIGVSLEDEAGKLDPNHMDTEVWDRLLQAVGIGDWDDGTGSNKDTDGDGQLAYALATARFNQNICPEGRITRLEQLLEAKPMPEGVRHPLTRSELAQLRPYLTLVPVGQGREGLIDLGTMVRRPGGLGSVADEVLDSSLPSDLVAYPTTPGLYAAGSVIVAKNPNRQLSPAQRQRGRKYEFGLSTSTDFDTMSSPSYKPRREDAIAVEIAAPINLIETSDPVRKVLRNIMRGTPNDLEALMRMTAGEPDAFDRPITGLHLVNPLGVFDKMDPNGQSSVRQTTPNDPNHGLPGNPPQSDGTLTATATRIHVSGGALNRMANSGYARIGSRNQTTNASQVEYIYYREGDPRGGTLHNVARGLNFPGSTGAHAHPAGSTIVFIAPRELPPLAIASQGLVTIESGASVADAAGRQGAQQMRRVVAQAVPQEQLLEKRWEKQIQYHALLVQRHGSLMNAFPKGYQRLHDELPENNLNGRNSGTKDDRIGVKPGTLRTHINADHLGTNRQDGRDWFVRFGVAGANPQNSQFADAWLAGLGSVPPRTGYQFQSLSPEGLPLISGPLVYPLFAGGSSPFDANTQAGFFTHPITTAIAAPLNGRQFGFWLKPLQTMSGVVTLMDLRSSPNDANERWAQGVDANGNQLTEPGDNYYQNRVTLTYEDATKQLVLTIANNATEHLVDHGPVCQIEEYKPVVFTGMSMPAQNGPYVDPRTLGTQASSGFTPGTRPLAPRRPYNLVQHRYQLNKNDGLKVDQWYLIQVALVGNDPGHQAIIVNGIVGKDISRPSPAGAGIQMNDPGDHLTLPSMVLRTALPATPDVLSGGGSTVYVPNIVLDAYAVDPATQQVASGAAAVDLLLPLRGVVRIGNEFISYEDRQGATLLHCLRGRRQDSYVDVNPAGNPYSVVHLEKHVEGDLVVPGGMRYSPNGRGHLWEGGCRLAQPLQNGDPERSYTVWGELKSPTTIDMTTGKPAIPPMATTIDVQNGCFMPIPGAQWPPRGFARLHRLRGLEVPVTSTVPPPPTVGLPDEIIYYDNGGANPTTQLLNVQRAQFGTTANIIIFPDVPTPDNVPLITLLSFEVDSNPIGTFPERIAPTPAVPNPFNEPLMVQISDPSTNRIEWISYDAMDDSKGAFFFINRDGFSFDAARRQRGNRARQRTAFAATDIPSGQAITFPGTSQVLPVQTSLDTSHVLLTGDVLTLTPKIPGSQPARQVCVRYAATDGFELSGARPTVPGDNTWDTVNRFFAFTEKLQERWNDNTFEMIAWPGWCGNDLTHPSGPNITNNRILPYFTMPLAGAFSRSGNPEIYVGGEDTSKPFRQGSASTPGQFVIDGLYAGVQPGGNGNPAPRDNLVSHFGSSVSNLKPVFDHALADKIEEWLGATPLSGNGLILRTTDRVFHRDLGLVSIGGEAFAFERQHNVPPGEVGHIIRLIGRSLLGSKPIVHRGPEPVLVLPIGPVTRLLQPLAQGGNTEQELFVSPATNKSHNQHHVVNAPAMLLCSPDGTKMELIAAPNRCVAPWHRGMYNTVPQGGWTGGTGAANAQTDTLVIGWWPRYPSGLPNRQANIWSAGPQQVSALLRCRMYAWMGFPIRFHDTWLTGGNGLVDIEVIDDGVGTYNVLAAALDEGFAWDEAITNSFTLNPSGAGQDASSIFSRFQRRPVDGVEVRVRWEYRLPPANPTQGGGTNSNPATVFLDQVATAGNTAPMIGKVKLRARAPVKILQVEDAR